MSPGKTKVALADSNPCTIPLQYGPWHIFWMEEKPKDNEYGGAIFALLKILHDDHNGGRNRYRIRPG